MGQNSETTGALIGAGASLLGSAFNVLGSGNMNKKNRKWQEEMYEKQRAYALADWNMQNEYNSPEMQMQRLRAAGLNPNLVYGKGADAQMGAPIRNTPSPQYRGEAPRVDLTGLGNSMQQYYDIKIKKQTLSNMEAQNRVAEQEALNKAASTAAIAQGTARSTYDLEMAKTLQNNTIAMSDVALKKSEADLAYTLSSNERAAASNAMSLKEAAERILNMRLQRVTSGIEQDKLKSQIQGENLSNELKQLDIDLRKKGVMPGDNIFFRVLGRVIDKYWPEHPTSNKKEDFHLNWGIPDVIKKKAKSWAFPGG